LLFQLDRLENEMDLQPILDGISAKIRPHLSDGRVADYIPALARVEREQFGMAIVTCKGEAVQTGAADTLFSIQSISKVFTLTLALGKIGNNLWHRVGREPSGSAFNSIMQLETEHGIPRNPLINAGAIVVTDVILSNRSLISENGIGEPGYDAVQEILDFVRLTAHDPTIAIDREVAESEAAHGFRNASLANFMKSFGNLENPVERSLRVYFHQCAIAMNCRQLARAGLFLAAEGRDPISGTKVVSSARARRINAIMLTCGHYDASGDFAFKVGLPGKSGVGGGILCIVPDVAAIAVWSPGLNKNGNSHAGTLALEMLARETGWSIF